MPVLMWVFFGGVWFMWMRLWGRGYGDNTGERWQAVVLAAKAVAVQYDFFQGVVSRVCTLGCPGTYPSIYSGVCGHHTWIS